METYMVVATFIEGADMNEVMAVRAREVARVAELRAEGRIGAVFISSPRGTVFIEARATGPEDAESVVRTLPMSRWWDVDVFPATALVTGA